jgi:hypothetical protein
MTRAIIHITLSDGTKIKCVADSSSAPEQGYIVEELILPLLSFNNGNEELRLLKEHCTMGEQRINADYRYLIDLKAKRVSMFEEHYFYKTGKFLKGPDITDRYDQYLIMLKS